MKKRKKRVSKARGKKTKKIGGWLIPVLLFCLCSAIYSSYLLIQRIIAIANNRVLFGVYISVIFLIIYCGSIWGFLYFSLCKKKEAINIFKIAAVSGIVFALWFFLIGQLIINPEGFLPGIYYYIPMLIVNLGFLAAVFFYLMKSKRARKTFVRK